MTEMMPPIPSATGPEAPPPDLSGLMGSAAPSAAPSPDSANAFMQMVKQLDEQVTAIATAHPEFSQSAEIIKKAIQEGTVNVVAKLKETESESPSAGLSYLG